MRSFILLGVVTLFLGQTPADAFQGASKAYLGVGGEAGAAPTGLIVRIVEPNSPAAKAGLKTGDVITRVGDTPVRDMASLTDVVTSARPGETVSLAVVRGGEEMKMTATLAERLTDANAPGGIIQAQATRPAAGDDEKPKKEQPKQPGERPRPGGTAPKPDAPPAASRQQAFLGVATVDHPQGVMVVEVVPDSAAAKAGVRPNDIITAVGDREVRDPMMLRQAVMAVGADKEAVVKVQRGNEKQDLKVKMGTAPATMPTPRIPRPRPPESTPPSGDAQQRIRELEARIQELEKRLKEAESRSKPKE